MLSQHGGQLVPDLTSDPATATHAPAIVGVGTAPEPAPVQQAVQQAAEPLAVAAKRAARFAKANRDAMYRRSLMAADALAAFGGLAIAMTATSHRLGAAAIATVPLIVAMSKVIGTYDREDLLVRKSTLDEAPALFQLATLYALTVWLLDGMLAGGALQRRGLFFLWVATLLLLLAFRAAARSLSRWVTPPERCLVVGDEDACVWMQTKFARRPSLHATVVGSVSPLHMRLHADGPTLASAQDLRALAGRLDIDRLVITADSADGPGIVDVVHTATTVGLKVSVLPRVLEVVGTSVEIDDVEGVPLLSMRPLSMPRSARIVKRALDLVGTVLGLLVLSPLLAAISAAILLDSGGPILFRQRRIGRDGQPFDMVKFRTMVPDAEERKHSLAHLNQATGLFKIADDPRMTRVGRFLRRTSLDELPQLLNVLSGEMSLVGPRPLVVEEDVMIEGWRRRRLHLTPGMTGHWQILGSARLPLDEMARIDYLYVTNWSLWVDVKILLRTVPYVLARRGM